MMPGTVACLRDRESGRGLVKYFVAGAGVDSDIQTGLLGIIPVFLEHCLFTASLWGSTTSSYSVETMDIDTKSNSTLAIRA